MTKLKIKLRFQLTIIYSNRYNRMYRKNNLKFLFGILELHKFSMFIVSLLVLLFPQAYIM